MSEYNSPLHEPEYPSSMREAAEEAFHIDDAPESVRLSSGHFIFVEERYTPPLGELLATIPASVAATISRLVGGRYELPPPPEFPRLPGEPSPDYLSRMIDLTPEEKSDFYTAIGQKKAELDQLYFDDPEALKDVHEAADVISWIYDGGTDGPLPTSIEVSSITADSIARLPSGKSHGMLEEFYKAVSLCTKRADGQYYEHNSAIKQAIIEHIQATPAYQFLQSFTEAVPTTSHRPLNEHERLIHEQQILGTLAHSNTLEPQDILRPFHSGKSSTTQYENHAALQAQQREDQAALEANKIFRKQAGQLELQTVPTIEQRKPTEPEIIERFKDYIMPLYKKMYGPLSNDPSRVTDIFAWEKVAAKFLGGHVRTIDREVLSHFCATIFSKYAPTFTTFSERLAYTLDSVAQLYVTSLSKRGRRGGQSDDDFHRFVSLVRNPQWPEEGSTYDSEQPYTIPRIPASAKKSIASQQQKEALAACKIGGVLLDDWTLEDYDSNPPRVISALPRELAKHTLPAGTEAAFCFRLDKAALQQEYGDDSQPHILGYELLGQEVDGDSVRFSFARLPGVEPIYGQCPAAIGANKQLELKHYFARWKLTVLAAAMEEQGLTVGELQHRIAEESIYYTPEVPVNYKLMEVRDGRAYMQCEGADALLTGALNAIFPNSTRGLGGIVIPRNGELTAAGHQLTLHRNGSRLYVLDATRGMTTHAGRREVTAKPLEQQPSEEANTEETPAAPAAEVVAEQIQPAPYRPEAIDPQIQARNDIKLATGKLQELRTTFERSARIRLGLEKEMTYEAFAPAYEKMLATLGEADPLRKTWSHIAYALPHSLGVPAYEADDDLLAQHTLEVQRLAEYTRNLRAMTPEERSVLRVQASDAALDAHHATATTLAYYYQKIAKARKALASYRAN